MERSVGALTPLGHRPPEVAIWSAQASRDSTYARPSIDMLLQATPQRLAVMGT